MDYKIFGLLVTLVLGIFILIGSIISLLSNKKDKYIDFSIALAFGVMITLIITELLPEAAENLKVGKIYLFVIFIILGYLCLDLLDHFIPDHNTTKMTKKEMGNNLIHIGLLSSIALVIHNIIEGMLVYSTVLLDQSVAVLSMIGVGSHNIALGMVIASTLYQNNNSKFKTLFIIILVALSSFIGGLIMFILNTTVVSNIMLGIFISLTIGMFAYILIDELYPKLITKRNRKLKVIGLVIGIAIILITNIIH